MKLFKQLNLVAIATFAIFGLAACGGNQSKKESLENHASVPHKTTKKSHDKIKVEKDESSTKKESAKELIKADPVKSGQATTSDNSKTKPAADNKTQSQKPATGNNNVNSAEDALSLYTHQFGPNSGLSDGYRVDPVEGGYVITPKESAYGHSQTIIKYDGNAYGTDGKLQQSFADMAAPHQGQPESGWHGY